MRTTPFRKAKDPDKLRDLAKKRQQRLDMIDDLDPPRRPKLSDKEDNIERIVKHERHYFEEDKAHKLAFFVKWEGYGEKYNTWEPFDNMSLPGNDVFEEYVKKNKLDYLLTGDHDEEGKPTNKAQDESDDDFTLYCEGEDSDAKEVPETPTKVSRLADVFKPRPGQWQCPKCFMMNESSATQCKSCATPKPGEARLRESDSSLADAFKLKPGEWECPDPECQTPNRQTDTKCMACGTPKPTADSVSDTVDDKPGQPSPDAQLDDDAFEELLQQHDLSDKEIMRLARLNSIQANPERARLQKRVNAAGFYLQDNDATGHCMFDAMRIQINERFPGDRKKFRGKPDADYTYKDVRRDAADWLRRNQNFELYARFPLKNFFYEYLGDDWEDFCDRVQHFFPKNPEKTPPTVQWGEHIHLIALANAYKRPIRVWASSDATQWWHEINPKDGGEDKEPFDIAHEFERHFLSVLPRHTKTPEDSDAESLGGKKKDMKKVKAKKVGFRDSKKAHAFLSTGDAVYEHLKQNDRTSLGGVKQDGYAFYEAVADQINKRYPKKGPTAKGWFVTFGNGKVEATAEYVMENAKAWLRGQNYPEGARKEPSQNLREQVVTELVRKRDNLDAVISEDIDQAHKNGEALVEDFEMIAVCEAFSMPLQIWLGNTIRTFNPVMHHQESQQNRWLDQTYGQEPNRSQFEVLAYIQYPKTIYGSVMHTTDIEDGKDFDVGDAY